VFRRWVIGALLLLAALLLAGRFAATLYVDRQWFTALGAQQLWWMQFQNQLLIVGGSAFAAFLYVFANLYAVRRSVDSYVLLRRLGNIQIGEKVPGAYLTTLAAGISVLVGLLLAMPAGRWVELAAARSSVSFRERDPFLTRDLSFFVNWLPFEKSLFVWCLIVVAASMLLVFLLYLLTPSLSWKRGGRVVATRYVRRHAAVLAASAMLLLAWSFRIENFQSLLEGSGVNGMFTDSDYAMLDARTLLALMSALAAFFLLWAMWTDQLRLALFCVTAVLLSAVGISTLAPYIMRRASGDRDQAGIDRQFEVHRAGRTRRAYAAQNADVAPAEQLAAYGFESWTAAARGTAVWEPERLAAAIISDGPASFVSTPVFLQSADGQVAEFITGDASPEPSGSAVEQMRERFFSVVTSVDAVPAKPMRAADPQNLAPVLIGESGATMLMVADPTGAVLAPSMRGTISRIAHAWSRQDFRMLFRSMPEPNPRVVLHAGIQQRVARLMPFLRQDSRVYPLVVGDTLHWLLHLYSASNSYPLSLPVTIGGTELRYMRHGALALINASTGGVRIYADQTPDPVVQGLLAALPDLFAEPREMPNEVAAYLPPPFDGHVIQAHIFALYGGLHDLPINGAVGTLAPTDSARYERSDALVHLPKLAPAPAATSIILDSAGRLDKLFLAVGGASPRSYQITLAPSDLLWRDIVQIFEGVRDSVDQSVPDRITGGEIRGVLVNDRLALIRTLYASPSNIGPQSVQAITLMYGDSTYVGLTLDGAVGAAPAGAGETPLSSQGFRRRAAALYESMRAALRRGDLAAFAELFDALGALIAGSGR
jgi:hypothetical protein